MALKLLLAHLGQPPFGSQRWVLRQRAVERAGACSLQAGQVVGGEGGRNQQTHRLSNPPVSASVARTMPTPDRTPSLPSLSISIDCLNMFNLLFEHIYHRKAGV